MDIELKETLVFLTRNLIATTETALNAQEMALKVYEFISSRHANIREAYEKAHLQATKLHAEREQQIQMLNDLLRRLEKLPR